MDPNDMYSPKRMAERRAKHLTRVASYNKDRKPSRLTQLKSVEARLREAENVIGAVLMLQCPPVDAWQISYNMCKQYRERHPELDELGGPRPDDFQSMIEVHTYLDKGGKIKWREWPQYKYVFKTGSSLILQQDKNRSCTIGNWHASWNIPYIWEKV